MQRDHTFEGIVLYGGKTLDVFHGTDSDLSLVSRAENTKELEVRSIYNLFCDFPGARR
jgi:hypothetical protein